MPRLIGRLFTSKPGDTVDTRSLFIACGITLIAGCAPAAPQRARTELRTAAEQRALTQPIDPSLDCSEVTLWPQRVGPARTPQSLATRVARYKKDIEQCHLKEQPVMTGQTTFVWEIAPNGTVCKVAVAKTSMALPHLNACILDRIKSWCFEPTPDETATFYFTFHFAVES